jgi:hypothetical protein
VPSEKLRTVARQRLFSIPSISVIYSNLANQTVELTRVLVENRVIFIPFDGICLPPLTGASGFFVRLPEDFPSLPRPIAPKGRAGKWYSTCCKPYVQLDYP